MIRMRSICFARVAIRLAGGAVLTCLTCRGSEAVAAAPHPSGKYGVRGVWLTTVHNLDWPKCKADTHTGAERQKRDLCNMLDKLKEAGINTVYLQVRGRGDLIYPSTIEPLSPTMASQGRSLVYDPLKYAVEECHRRGMRISAWIVTLPLGNSRYVNRLGQGAYASTHRQKCVLFNGEWYMDPADTATDEHLIEICKEIVCRYDVDGIHLDYIRYPDKSERFPDGLTYRKGSNGTSLPSWRQSNISRIVEAISQQIKLINPSIELSSAPLGKYRRLQKYPRIGWTALESVYQDPVRWGAKRTMDAIVPMMYYKDEHFYPFVHDWLSVTKMPLVIGIGAYRMLPGEGGWTLSDIKKQIDFAENTPGVKGVCYFRAEQVVDDRWGLFRLLKEHAREYPSLPLAPADSAGVLPPAELQIDRDGESLCLRWNAPASYPHMFTIYRSVAKEVDKESDLLATTQDNFFRIPLNLLKDDELYYFRIGIYRLRDGAEGYTDSEVYYHRR